MTATIGIGDKVEELGARDYILNMCAKFCLKSPPGQSKMNSQEIRSYVQRPEEGRYASLECRCISCMHKLFVEHVALIRC